MLFLCVICFFIIYLLIYLFGAWCTADFGISAQMNEHNSQAKERIGTPLWMVRSGSASLAFPLARAHGPLTCVCVCVIVCAVSCRVCRVLCLCANIGRRPK
jgi:hypothetical protein